MKELKFMKSTTYFLFILFVFLILGITSCTGVRNKIISNQYKRLMSYGFVQIGDNLFYDQTEIRNLDYDEYVYWTSRVFGRNSKEYKSAMPDTLVWIMNDNKCLNFYVDYYLRHPSYRNYPVVGISQKQADDYSKWRSDRVFEYLLIKLGKISIDKTQNSDSHFTIEGYFDGTYHNQKPDTTIKYYPEYRMPTVQEWRFAVKYMDSVDNLYFKKHSNKLRRNSKNSCAKYQCGIIPCINDSLINYPTREVWLDSISKRKEEIYSYRGHATLKKKTIYNLRGNVREWTAEKSICVGGGWKDSKETVLRQDTFYVEYPNEQTGFRNVCVLKKREK
jgi:hypothetical protein